MDREEATRDVSALYRIVLDREPDAAGMQQYVGALLAAPQPGALKELLIAFLNGDEARRCRASVMLRTTYADILARTPLGFAADSVFSLGTHCYTSWLLKLAGLKARSGPFDWLFTSMAMVRDCLEDDFAKLLDRRWYQPVPVDQRVAPWANKCHHQFYRQSLGIDHVFNHRDPSGPEDYDYLLRCVARLRVAARSPGKTLLVCCFRDSSEAIDEFMALERAVEDYFASSVLVGCMIQRQDTVLPSVRTIRDTGSSKLLGFAATSEWQDLQFGSHLDDMCLFASIVQALSGAGEAQRSEAALSE